MRFRNFHNERVSAHVDVDDVDLEISIICLHQSWFQKMPGEQRSPNLVT